jgi:amino acid transporter
MAKLQRGLGTLSLVFILYFTTSGGPHTTETLVHEVGPGLALLIMLAIPIFWSVPEVLIVGELASMLPEEGGYYKWVQRAFGDRWAFQNGWLTWLYSLVDMAIYPVLFLQYFGYFFPELSAPIRYALMLAVIWIAGVNLRGALPVGRISIAAGLFIIAGFLLVAILAIPNIHHAPWTPFAAPGVGVPHGMAVGLSIALWNYIGWDNASTVEGELKDATRSYPRALAITLPLITAGYFIPLLATLGSTDWTTWKDGGWPQIAAAATGPAGRWLAPWIALGGMVSALALFNALLLAYSRVPFAMANDRLLPRAIAKLDARGTPRNSVLASAVIYSIFVLAPLASLVVADALLYSLALSLEFAALIRLRKTEPELRGAFRLPVGRRGVIALTAPPFLILTVLVVLSFRDGEYGLPAVIGSGVGVAAGFVLYNYADRKRCAPAVNSDTEGTAFTERHTELPKK